MDIMSILLHPAIHTAKIGVQNTGNAANTGNVAGNWHPQSPQPLQNSYNNANRQPFQPFHNHQPPESLPTTSLPWRHWSILLIVKGRWSPSPLLLQKCAAFYVRAQWCSNSPSQIDYDMAAMDIEAWKVFLRKVIPSGFIVYDIAGDITDRKELVIKNKKILASNCLIRPDFRTSILIREVYM